MRVASCRVYRYDLPLARPLTLKGKTIERRTGLVLRVTSDGGATGYGEAAPLPCFSHETTEEVIKQALRLASELPGKPVPQGLAALTDDFARWLRWQPLLPSLGNAVQMAVLNMLAGAESVPLCALLSPHPLTKVPVNALLTGTREDVLQGGTEARDAGYRAVKVKVGHARVDDDIETVRALREILGDDVALRLDANRAWDYDTALRFATAVLGCGIQYIEEPTDEPSRIVEFMGYSGMPVALDETVVERGTDMLEAWRGARAAVLKPTLLGGPEVTLNLARRARNTRMIPVLSSCFETGLGLLALANLASAMYEGNVAMGLDTRTWLGADTMEGTWRVEEGLLDVAHANTFATRIAFDRLQEIPHV
jgi:o-succinylbenzoate synthase